MGLLFDCLRAGTNPVSAVAFARQYLLDQQFEELEFDSEITPERGGRYVITPFPDVLFAFTVGGVRQEIPDLRMAMAHVDQPGFKVKAKPDFSSMGSDLINVEVYGGMMDHTWFDRPLGLAGSVAVRGERVMEPEILPYQSKHSVAVIPGIAIHMMRNANEGWKIDRQKELMPVVGISGEKIEEGRFRQFLSRQLSVDSSDILSYDMNLYNMDQPVLTGFHQELVCSPRIDNLASVSALLNALVESRRDAGINLIGLFNHEEVGSFTKSGADSELLSSILKHIITSMEYTEEEFRQTIAAGSYLSVDGAHGAHPNYPEKADTTSRAYVGQGPAVKLSGTQKYATDFKMQAILRGLADKYDIPLQEINDRNTIRGGTTLGPIVASHLPMMGCDIGIPMWAMHSALETMALEDYESLCQIVTAYFQEAGRPAM